MTTHLAFEEVRDGVVTDRHEACCGRKGLGLAALLLDHDPLQALAITAVELDDDCVPQDVSVSWEREWCGSAVAIDPPPP